MTWIRPQPSIRTSRRSPDDDADGLPTRLERYAARALAPDRETFIRIRDQVRLDYYRRSRRWTLASRPTEPARHRTAVRIVGRLSALALVALLIIVGFGAIGPGQPLYRLRLSFELLSLPQTPADRIEAELRQMRARLAEAEQAAKQGDVLAMTDAVGAYLQALDRTAAEARGLPISRTALAAHLATLSYFATA